MRTLVLDRIRSQTWPPGTLIPTEHDLARELGCARATVNRALRDLADAGVVERRRKVGTRVACPPRPRSEGGMPSVLSAIGETGAAPGYALLHVRREPASAAAANALQIGQQNSLLRVYSQFTADSRPYCYEALWLNPMLLPDIDQAAFGRAPATEWVIAAGGVDHVRTIILAEPVQQACAAGLGIGQGTPVLVIERILSSGRTPLAFARQVYPPGHRLLSDS